MSANRIIRSPVEVSSADEAIAVVINTIMKEGEHVPDKKSRQGDFIEKRNLQFLLTEPLRRIALNPKRPINLIAAISRFVWMISGSDRLEDIAFYQENVRFYTDNGLSVPGSSYGKRLFEPLPGVDQIRDVIEILKENPSSRRACASIWQPIDASRISSKDMPCAFGLNFEIRDGKLFSTLVMRSNNATDLLHMNLFEFTLLGEIIAKELGVKYGGHIHNVFSMHIFEKDKARAETILESFKTLNVGNEFFTMPDMPSEPSPLEEAKKLARLETTLRNQNVFYDLTHLDHDLEHAKDLLHSYWYEFYKVLAIGALVRILKFEKARKLTQSLQPYFRRSMMSQLSVLEKQAMEGKHETLDKYADEHKSKFEIFREIYSLPTSRKKEIEIEVTSLCDEWNQSHKKKLTTQTVNRVVNLILANFSMAARSAIRPHSISENSNDYLKISKNEVFDLIRKILDKKDQNEKLM